MATSLRYLVRQENTNIGVKILDLRLQRGALLLSAGLMTVMASLWALMYFYYGEYWAAAIPFGYSLFSVGSFACSRRGSFKFMRHSQLVLSLLLPFLLMWALGGLVGSSGVILWSLICPLGALIFVGRRQAVAWFCAFVGLVILSAVVEYPAIRPENNLPIFVIVAFFVLNILGVSTVAIALTGYFVGKTQENLELLDAERAKSEDLLHNMLPAAISERLKADRQPIADGLDGVSILFIDIVGFTRFAMRRDPSKVVALLNEIFSNFDELAERHGLEKIKTIGDAYMICGGLAVDSVVGAKACAKFSLDVAESLRSNPRHDVSVRMGMHVGPVVAGVIGKRKLSYDIWGDTVNVAARLQQVCRPDHILVSAAFAELLTEGFEFTEEGETELRGHTPVHSFYLVGRQRSQKEVSVSPSS